MESNTAHLEDVYRLNQYEIANKSLLSKVKSERLEFCKKLGVEKNQVFGKWMRVYVVVFDEDEEEGEAEI